MIRVSQLKLPVEHSEEQFYQKIEKSLKIKRDQIKKLQIVKKSIDARKKPEVSIVYSVDVWVDKEEKILKHSGNKNAVCVKEKKYKVPEHGTECMNHRPVVIRGRSCRTFLCVSACKGRIQTSRIRTRKKSRGADRRCFTLLENRRTGSGIQRAVWRRRCRNVFRRKIEYSGERSSWAQPVRIRYVCLLWSTGENHL